MFYLNFHVFFTLLFLTLECMLHIAVAAVKKYPCSYADTVNITDGLRLKDGSYSFEGMLIPANLTAEYNVKVIDGIEYGAARHMRGCICLLKPCITFCCPFGMIFNEKYKNCTQREVFGSTISNTFNVDVVNSIAANRARSLKSSHIEVTYPNGNLKVVSLTDAFVIRYEFGCKHKYLEPNDADFWKWDLFLNGTMSRDGKLWSTVEYCFTPLEHKKVWSLTPLTCVRHERGLKVWIHVICIALAIVINAFMALLLVSIRRFRNNSYGELIIFYLISLVIAHVFLVYLALKNPLNLTESACRSIGFIAYYFIMLSFLLLNFVSWEFWCKFEMRLFKGWKRKLMYALIVLIAFALKFIVKFVQDSNIEQYLKPGIGDAVCWFDVRLLGIFFYYYLPILISLAISIFCATKAYLAMWNLTDDDNNISKMELKLIKSQFYAFLTYLVGVICITVREISVWLTARLREHYFIFDFFTGVFILALSVTGFICFLWKNKLVKSWWKTNVSNKPDDFLGVQPAMSRTYKTEDNMEIHRNDKTEQTALK